MATHDDPIPLSLPSDRMWSSIGLQVGHELHGGHQSRVFAAQRDGEEVVVKLTDGRLVDSSFAARREVAEAAAATNSSVVAPTRSRTGPLVVRLGGWLAITYPFVVGRVPDIERRSDVAQMATTLALLHRSFDHLGPFDVPPVRAIADIDPPGAADGFGSWQLLHGDFSHSNVLLDHGRAHVLDFDECGYGPVEFEIGNTLYMVLFDATLSEEIERYERFREWFVDDYRSASGRRVSNHVVDVAIRLRIEALSRWLEQPEIAPIGVQTATPEWRRSLRAFVKNWESH